MGVNPHSIITFAELKGKLFSLRLSVYEALLEHGPCTTRELARVSEIDILTVRPRITELCQFGFVVEDEATDRRGHEGTYRALTLAEAEVAFKTRQKEAVEQGVLEL